MPIYDYRCNVCSKNFEILSKMDEELTSYPGCEDPTCNIIKCISLSSFHLKGTGWTKP
jgi:putative FmdB family regulatory protein